MCVSVDIDGHAFCLGLDVWRTALDNSTCLVTALIRGAIFRSRDLLITKGRHSQDICSLGELVDRYHTQIVEEVSLVTMHILGGSNSDDSPSTPFKL
jgi:hypothetical protein